MTTTDKPKTRHMNKAKLEKNDEFYTQYEDVEKEMQYYKEHFRDRVIFCNCDDARVSQFYRYFANNFHNLGLKKLIAASYKKQEGDPSYDENNFNGTYYIYTGSNNEVRHPTTADINYFKGDGDFRSHESMELLRQSDIVITNPPFSLFREFMAQCEHNEMKVIILGIITAIAYKDIFRLIKEGKLWLGVNNEGSKWFEIPNYYDRESASVKDLGEGEQKLVSMGGRFWYTNLNPSYVREFLPLTRTYDPISYPKFDNYDIINVDRTKDIPMDYDGIMGVPISFMSKYNPEQFQIVGMVRDGGVCSSKDIWDGVRSDCYVNGKCKYHRIFVINRSSSEIRHKLEFEMAERVKAEQIKVNKYHFNVNEVLRLNIVKRWGVVECLRTQSIAEHSYNVAMIALAIYDRLTISDAKAWEYKSQLLEWALRHDIPESYTGDIPTPFKIDIKNYEDIEKELFPIYTEQNQSIDPLVRSIIKIADLLDAIRFTSKYCIDENKQLVLTGLVQDLQKVFVEQFNSLDSVELRKLDSVTELKEITIYICKEMKIPLKNI